MKSTVIICVTIILAAFIMGHVGSSNAAVPGDPDTAYTYRLIILSGTSTNQHQATLNAMGDAGWELVGVESNTAYLKRKVR